MFSIHFETWHLRFWFGGLREQLLVVHVGCLLMKVVLLPNNLALIKRPTNYSPIFNGD